MSIYKVVLTGGPCAGKSTGLAYVENRLTKLGYKVFVVPETATEVILGGVNAQSIGIKEFEAMIMELQMKKEELYERAANMVKDKDVVIIYDRGVLDCKAFLEDNEFNSLLERYNKTESEIRDKYDIILHLRTAADGAEEFYTLSNNKARKETPEQAIESDNKVLRAWTGHPHLRVIDNSTNFEGKMHRLLNNISNVIDEPEHLEVERKLLISMPDMDDICKKYTTTCLNIIQTYLPSDGCQERRIRQRGLDGNYSYFYTEKKGTGLVRSESERRITEREYLDLLMQADVCVHQIRKNRNCIVYKNSYIELDVYSFWDDVAIVEVELTDENQCIELPPEIKVIADVTEDGKFKNRKLAESSIGELKEIVNSIKVQGGEQICLC